MALETATYISDLDESNPVGTDPRATVDDHLRLIKAAVKRTFPNVTSVVSASHAELNRTMGLSSSAQDQINALITGKMSNSATAAFAISANYAQSAGAASTAALATRAISADNAGSAVYAYSATRANFAASAGAASEATIANRAISADAAGSAVYANSATNATNAASAVFADSARAATSAVQANTAVFAVSAGDYNGPVSIGQIDAASAGGAGVVELATDAEVSAGAATLLAITPASLLAAGLGFSKLASGYVRLPGGLILQWGVSGSVSSGSGSWVDCSVAFPIAFPSGILQAVGSLHVTGVPASNTADTLVDVGASTASVLACYIRRSQAAGTFQVSYIAIGH